MKLFRAFRRAYVKSKPAVIFYRYLSRIKRQTKIQYPKIRNQMRELYKLNRTSHDVCFSLLTISDLLERIYMESRKIMERMHSYYLLHFVKNTASSFSRILILNN